MDLSSMPSDAASLAQAIGLNTLGPVRVNSNLFGDTTAVKTSPSSTGFSGIVNSIKNVAGTAIGAVAHSAWSVASSLPSDIGANLARSHQLNPAIQQSQELTQRANTLFAARNTMSKEAYGTALRQLTQQGEKVSNNITNANKLKYAGTAQVAKHAAETGGLALTALAPVAEPLEAAAEGAAGASGARAALEASKGGQLATKAIEATGIPAKALDSNPLIATAGKLTRNALLTQPTVNMVPQFINDVKTRNYTALAANTALMTSLPLLTHFAAPVIAQGVQKLGLKMFGDPTFLSKFQFKDGETFKSFFNDLSNKAMTDPQAQQDLVKYMDTVKQFEAHNAQEGNTAQKVIDSEAKNLRPVSGQTAQQFLDYHGDFIKDTQKVQSTVGADPSRYGIPNGVSTDRLGVGNFSTADKNQLIGELMNAPDQGAREAIISRDVNSGADYTRNQGVLDQVWQAVRSGDPGQIDQIKDITASRPIEDTSPGLNESFGLGDKTPPMPDDFLMKPGEQPTAGVKSLDQPLSDQLNLSNGRIPIVKPEGAAGFGNPDDLPAPDFGQERSQILGRYGKLLENLGLSPQAVENGAISASIRTNLDNELQDTRFENQGTFVMRKLQDATGTAGVADVRELKNTDIQAALNINKSEAKTIQSAVKDAYLKAPLNQVGLGPKVINQVVGRVPFMDNYLRLQQKLRFDNNPFFQARRMTKNYLAALAKGGAFIPRPNEETLSTLRGEGVFNKFNTDQGTSDFLGVMPDESIKGGEVKTSDNGRAGKQMSGWEQRIIGGLAESIAAKNGQSVQDVMATGGDAAQAIRSAAKLTTGYGDGGYLNSPLAKTLNVLVFPSRFDTKIGMIAYHALAEQPPVVQAMAMRGIANMSNFLNSQQGQKWQQDNAPALSIIKYFTPLGTIDGVMSFLTKGYHVGDLGSIGGLPLGVVTEFLNDLHPYGPLGSSQYYDPATGDPVPDQVPNTDKATAQVALRDLIESTFSYPGSEIGLPSKNTVTEAAIPFTKTATGSTTPTYAPGVSPNANSTITPPDSLAPGTLEGRQQPAPININSLPVIPSATKTKSTKSKTVPASLQIQH